MKISRRLCGRGRHPCHRSESGQALVEVAILTPILLLLLLGSVDFGRFAYDGIVLGNAARAGVQYGSLSLTNASDFAGMKSAASTDSQGVVPVSAVTATNYCQCANAAGAVACSKSCSPSYRLVYVQVVTTGTFQPLIGYPGLPSSVALSRTAVMQVSP